MSRSSCGKFAGALIAILGFAFGANVASAGMEVICGGESANYVSCQYLNYPASFAVWYYPKPVTILLYSDDTLQETILNTTSGGFSFPVNSSFSVINPFNPVAEYNLVAVPVSEALPTTKEEALLGNYDHLYFTGTVQNVTWQYMSGTGDYEWYYTDPPPVITPFHFSVMSTDSSTEFISSLTAGVANTGASLWVVASIAIGILVTFWVIVEVMALFPEESEKERKRKQRAQDTINEFEIELDRRNMATLAEMETYENKKK